MADSINSITPDLINVNYESKPDTSKSNKNLSFNKDYNQDKDFEKSSASDKFKNSPLLADKKFRKLSNPSVSPLFDRKSTSILHAEEKIINSPSPIERAKSPFREEKIINSPLSSRSNSRSQEFHVVNPVSRSGSTSSPADIPISPAVLFLDSESKVINSDQLTRERSESLSENEEHLDDGDIRELLSHEMEVQPSLEGNVDNPKPEQNSEAEAPLPASDATQQETSDDAPLEVISPLAVADEDTVQHIQGDTSETVTAEIYPNEYVGDTKKSDDILLIQNNPEFDSEDALSGLLEIAEMADDIGFSDDGFDNISLVMSTWIEESITNLKDMLRKTAPRQSKRRNTTAIATPVRPIIKINSPEPTHDSSLPLLASMKPVSPMRIASPVSSVVSTKSRTTNITNSPKRRESSGIVMSPVRPEKLNGLMKPRVLNGTFVKTQKDASPLSRFTQPQFEQRLAAKLTTMQPVSDRHEIATSPIHDEVTPSRRKPISISQSTSGDFTGSSRNSPFGEYDSNYTSETYSRSYTPSYSYTPSDQSDMSECSSPSSPDGLKRSSSAGLVRPRFVRPPVLRGGRGIRGGFRGRATGIQRVRSSHSGDQLGGLIESSSAESFMSNTSEADFMPTHKTPRLQPGYGLKRPAASHNTASPKSSLSPQPGRKQAGTKPGIKRPAETPKQVAARPGIQKPSGLQKPRGGIPKPSGIGKPRGSGIVRPGLKKPTKTLQSSWDDGCY